MNHLQDWTAELEAIAKAAHRLHYRVVEVVRGREREKGGRVAVLIETRVRVVRRGYDRQLAGHDSARGRRCRGRRGCCGRSSCAGRFSFHYTIEQS